MNQYIDQFRLDISYIPAFFGGISFKDSLGVDGRFELLPDSFLQQVKTEKYYRTVENTQLSKQLIVQSIKRNRYLIELYNYESTRITNLQTADKIEVVNNYSEIITCEIESITVEPIAGTAVYKHKVILIDLTTDTDQITNHLKSDSSFNVALYCSGEYFAPVGTVDPGILFYTRIYPELITGIQKVESIEADNIKNDLLIQNFNAFKVKFYLDNQTIIPGTGLTETQLFDTYVQYSFKETIKPILRVGFTTYTALERIEVAQAETQNNLVGISEREIIFKTQINNLYVFD